MVDRPAPLVAEIAEVRALLESHHAGREMASDDVHAAPGTAADTPLDRLAAVMSLSAFERRVVVTAAGVELDGSFARLVAEMNGTKDPRPTFGLLLTALPGGHWDALAPASPLRWWQLVDLDRSDTLATRALRLDESVLHYLVGITALDERLRGIREESSGGPGLAPSQRVVAEDLARTVAGAHARMLVRLEGRDVAAVHAAARYIGAVLGRHATFIRGDALPPPGPDLAAVGRLIDRSALLADELPVLDGEGAGDETLRALIDGLVAPVVLLTGSRTGVQVKGRDELHGSIGWPSPSEQKVIWLEALGLDAVASEANGGLGTAIDDVTQHYRLGVGAVEGAARELLARATTPSDLPASIARLCRQRTRTPLGGLAERVDTHAGWDDLVLPPGQIEMLRDIARQVRHRAEVYERWGFAARGERGLGVTALFAGESGTGKTLAAEVLASDLD
ncbi:MAG TPA: hypothetical protein VIG64_14290, partial [Actinomycetota bacterium]